MCVLWHLPLRLLVTCRWTSGRAWCLTTVDLAFRQGPQLQIDQPYVFRSLMGTGPRHMWGLVEDVGLDQGKGQLSAASMIPGLAPESGVVGLDHHW